jgi:hypothetical protein
MATTKQPAFPHPPLEVGVPQYPTPIIPSFIDRNGHIVLVEKVSAEKGSYTPQKPAITDVDPVIYKGRDAKKWPETLYLVHERPTPDGEFVYRYWANDRSLASQDPWNYGVTYSGDDPNYPIYTRQYIVPRSQYTPVQLGNVDPVFGGTAKIVEQQLAELGEDNPLRSRYVLVQRVYESIPGPHLTGTSVNQYGVTQTASDQIVDPNTQPSLNGFLVSDSVTSVSAGKSRQQRVVMDAPPPDVITYEISHDTAVVKNTTKMVLRSDLTAPSITGAILDVSDVDIGFPWIKRTIKSLPLNGNGDPILPPSRIEYRSIQHTFPGIIYTWKTRQNDNETTANLSFFDNRYPISMTVSARSVITYHVGEQDLSTENFFKVITRPWAIQFFNIPDGTIHPPAPVNLSTASISTNGIAIQIAGGQSSDPIHYTVGEDILIGGDCERWQGNIFIKRLEYVREPL